VQVVAFAEEPLDFFPMGEWFNREGVSSLATSLHWLFWSGYVQIPSLGLEPHEHEQTLTATREGRERLGRAGGCRMVGGRCVEHGGGLARGPGGFYCRRTLLRWRAGELEVKP
jgi:hypothetical protein